MSILLAISIVIAQGLAGMVWWWALRSQRGLSWAEVMGMGLALGTVVSLIVGVLTRPVLGTWGWSVPVAMTVVAVVFRLSWLKEQVARTRLPAPHAIALALGTLAGLTIIVGNWIRVPLNAVSDASYADIYFFEGLSRSVAQFGPRPSIFMEGGQLPYHWFTYGWVGQVAGSAGTEPFFVLTRLLPILAAVSMVLLAVAWTELVHVTRALPRWVPTLAAVLVVFAGYTGALYGSILSFDSPSQSMATVWLLGFGLAMVAFLRGGSWILLVAVVVLAAALVGGKVSHAAVAAAGLVTMAVVGSAVRAPWRFRAWVTLALSGVAMAITYWLVLRGAALDQNITEAIAVKASTWQGLDPLVGRWGPVLGTLALILAMSARPAGLGLLFQRRGNRTDPAVLFTLGGFLAGLGAVLVLREGINETWFALAASAPAGALSAVGLGIGLSWLSRRGVRHPLALALAVTLPISLLVLILTWNWPIDPQSPAPRVLPWLAAVLPWLAAPLLSWFALRRQAPLSPPAWQPIATLAIAVVVLSSIATRPAATWTATRPVNTQIGVVQPSVTTGSDTATTSVDSLPADRNAGATWLLDNAPRKSIIATTNTTSGFLPAVTGLRTYLSAQLYQAGLGAAGSREEVDRRASLIADLTSSDAEVALAELCDFGVDYFWIERPEEFVDGLDVDQGNVDFTSDQLVIHSRTGIC